MGTLVKTVKQKLFRVSFGGPMSPRHTRRVLAAAVSATLAASGAALANTVDLTAPNDDTHPNKDIFLGGNAVGAAAVTQTYFRDGGATNAGDITHIFDNSNVDGVTGTDASGAATGVKGFEWVFSSQFL